MTDKSDLIVRMDDVRSVTMCSRGARAFFKRHGLDWTEFLQNGVSADKLVATDDPMALQVVEAVRGRQQQ